MREPGWNLLCFKPFPPFSTTLECPRALQLLCKVFAGAGTPDFSGCAEHNLQTCCLDSKFCCLVTSGMWYVLNLQVDEGSSDDQVREVNTTTYFNVALNKGLKNVSFADPLSQQTFLPGNIFARWLVKVRSEGM